MDKETAVELERLKSKVERLEKDYESWNQLIRQTVIRVVKWLLGVGLMGMMFGYHLPEDIRKAIANLVQR